MPAAIAGATLLARQIADEPSTTLSASAPTQLAHHEPS
jgi:hypothetical protein